MSLPAMSDGGMFTIGLVAYGIDGPNPNLVFVRVPTERGRWVLTDRCVVEVPCSRCGAIVGEPCRRNWGFRFRTKALSHGAGTHADRRTAWQLIKHTKLWHTTPKLRLRAEDYTAPTDPHPDDAYPVEVIPKEPDHG